MGTPPHALGFRSLDPDRTFRAADLDVSGSLPDWLDGTLLRNGPGLFAAGDREFTHWFDGLALLRRFRIRGDENAVSAGVRYLDSEEFRAVRERGRLARGQFGTPAADSWLGHLRALAAGTLTDNASVTFRRTGDGGTVAVSETPRGHRIDPETLETLAPVRRDRGLDVTGMLGHVHADPAGDGLVNMGIDLGRTSAYVLYRRPPGGDPEPIARHRTRRPAYFHSFGVTPRYVVLFESPFRLSPRDLLTPGAFIDAYGWAPDAGARFLVFDRTRGEVVATPRAEPAFAYHHANAHEDGDALIVDLVAYDHGRTLSTLELDSLRSAEPELLTGELRRYRLPLSGGPAREWTVHPGPVEFPTVDYRRVNGRPYRYAYAAGNRERPPATLTDRLLKVDVEAETERASWAQPATLTGEPLFVPRTDDPDRPPDDGVLLSVVLRTDAERSALVVLDAADLSELARAPLPTALPLGFHGQFYRGPDDTGRSMA